MLNKHIKIILITAVSLAGFSSITATDAVATEKSLKINGYIVELKGDPVAKSLKSANGELNREVYKKESTQKIVKERREAILAEHKQAKKDMQSRLGFDDQTFGKKVRGETNYIFNSITLDISAEEAAKLKGLGSVKEVYPNTNLELTLDQSIPLIGADKVWTMSSTPGFSCFAKMGEGCLNGYGIRIGIVDTGVDYMHPDISGGIGANWRVAGGYDFANNDNNPMDDIGHGTHVASIALKVAPWSRIYAYKYCTPEVCALHWAVQAFDRAANEDKDGNPNTLDPLDVVNASFGGVPEYSVPITIATDNLVDLGIVVVAAAGNSGPDTTYYDAVQAPGVARKAITVGGTTKPDSTGKEALYAQTSNGPVNLRKAYGKDFPSDTYNKPDISAPGVNICAAQWQDYFSSNQCKDSNHTALTGTSMATPHVTGSVALLKQAHPSWTPEQIKYALRNSAKDLSYSPNFQGTGRLDIASAAQKTQVPPIIELLPIFSGGTTTELKARFKINNFKQYVLRYAPESTFTGSPTTTKWYLVKTSTVLPYNGLVHTFQNKNIPNGKYIVMLEAFDNYGGRTVDYTNLNINIAPSVIFPTYNSTLLVGNSYDIKWDGRGLTNQKVDIILSNSSNTTTQKIYSQTQNDGTQNWLVPKDITPATTYWLRLVFYENGRQTYSISSQGFKITQFYQKTPDTI